MRALYLGLMATALLSGTPALASPQPQTNVFRDCQRNQDYGQHPPSRSGSRYLYIMNVMVEKDTGEYGAVVGWAVKGSLKEACDYALTSAAQERSPSQGWSIQGATVQLVPDNILKDGLAH